MQGVQNGMQPLCQFTPAAPICCRHRPALVGKNVGQDRVRVPCRVDQFDQGAGTGGDLRGGIQHGRIHKAFALLLARVDALQQQTPSLVVAVSEGVRTADGRYVCELAHNPVNVDAFGHTYLGGTAHYLSGLIAARLHSKTRAVELSTLQRCAAHVASETDVSESFDVGAFAVDAACEGKTGVMAALKRVSDEPYVCGFELHDIHDIANLEKKIPLDWIDAEHYRLREPFFAYARPLIAEEVKPEYQKGLPRHLKLKR